MIVRTVIGTAAFLIAISVLTGEAAQEPSVSSQPDAAASRVPLPPKRPAVPPAANPAEGPDASEHTQPGNAEEFAACQARLSASAAFEPVPPIIGPGQCGARDLVRVEGMHLEDDTLISVQPPAIMRCELAEVLVDWIATGVAPAVASAGNQLANIRVDTSYECRTRNHIAGSKMSEHASGNAIDVRELTLSNGDRLDLTDGTVSQDLRSQVAGSACSRFTTVLGPGADAHHSNHIHLDLRKRRSGYRICQWEIR